MQKILIIAFVLLTNKMIGQEYTLKQVVDYALQNNVNSKTINLNIEKAQQRVKESTAIGLPQVNASGNFQHNIDLPTQLIPANAFNPAAPSDEFAELQFGTKFNTTGAITVNQLLFDGSYFVGLQAAKKYKETVGIEGQKSKQDVRQKVTSAYYTVLVAKENVDVISEILSSTQKIYDDTKLIYDAGLMELQDLEQMELSVLSVKSQVDEANRMYELSKNALKFEMGMPVNDNIKVNGSIDSLIKELKPSLTSEEINPKSNIDYQILSKNIELGELQVKLEKARRLPSLGAFFSHQQTAMRNDFNFFANKPWYPTTVWGLQLNVPIWSSGQGAARIKQAQIDVELAKTQQSNLENAINLQAQKAKSDFDGAYEKTETQKQKLDLAQKIHEKTLIKYKEGVSTSLDITQTQNQVLSEKANYINSVFQMLNAKVELDKLTNKFLN